MINFIKEKLKEYCCQNNEGGNSVKYIYISLIIVQLTNLLIH